MSIRYSMVKLFIKLIQAKKFTSLSIPNLIKTYDKVNRFFCFELPENKKGCTFSDEIITIATDGPYYYEKNMETASLSELPQEKNAFKENSFHCLHITPTIPPLSPTANSKDNPAFSNDKSPGSDTAILFIYGSAMLFNPLPFQKKYAVKIAERTGREVYFPYYPLSIHYTIRDSLNMLVALYKKMLTRHKKVYLYGYSSGGALAMLMCALINEEKLSLPMPQKQIIISPGGVAANREEAEAMKKIDYKDILIDSDYLTRVKPLLTHGNQDIPEYMTTFNNPDMSSFPETYLYYGGDECLSVKIEAYIELMKANKVKFKAKKAPGMPHCYCAIDIFPEAKKDYDQIIEILKN